MSRPAGAGEPWGRLPDGTPFVGEIGVLAVDEVADEVQCHLCGRWLRSIGGTHLRVTHGWTAELYREAFGLSLHRSLDCPGRNAQRSDLQRSRVVSDPVIREVVARAVARSRNGELQADMRAARSDPARQTHRRAERLRIAKASAALGTAASLAKATARYNAAAAALGFPDIAAYLTSRVTDRRSSISAMSAELGIARDTVAGLLDEHRVARAEQQEESEALHRVGFQSFPDYLRDRQRAGWTVAEMARELGHSGAWVLHRAARDNLEHLTRPGPDALTRATEEAKALGFAGAAEYLRHCYETEGLDARQLQARFGIHPQRIARLLDTTGVARRHHPQVSTESALSRVGFDDLRSYALDRHAKGFTIDQMAKELGHSHPWLAPRLRDAGLAHLIGTPGRPTADPDVLTRDLGFDGLTDYVQQRAGEGATVVAMAAELGHSNTWLTRHLRAAGLGHLIGRSGPRPTSPRRQR